MADETLFDKSDWPVGPWQTEPDKRTLTTSVGLDAVLLRSPSAGHWVVYVGVPFNHPLHGLTTFDEIFVPRSVVNAQNAAAIEAAFSAATDRAGEVSSRITRSFQAHRSILVVWHSEDPELDYFGLALAGPGDRSPRGGTGGAYRDVDFATQQAESLARQIEAYGSYRTRVGGPNLARRPVRSENETTIATR